ncbi:hypothetical protein GCM10022294_25720 [Dietzia aurantiaca]
MPEWVSIQKIGTKADADTEWGEVIAVKAIKNTVDRPNPATQGWTVPAPHRSAGWRSDCDRTAFW